MKCTTCGNENKTKADACEYCNSNLVNEDIAKSKSNRKNWLWVIGLLFIFPIPLTICLLRKKI